MRWGPVCQLWHHFAVHACFMVSMHSVLFNSIYLINCNNIRQLILFRFSVDIIWYSVSFSHCFLWTKTNIKKATKKFQMITWTKCIAIFFILMYRFKVIFIVFKVHFVHIVFNVLVPFCVMKYNLSWCYVVEIVPKVMNFRTKHVRGTSQMKIFWVHGPSCGTGFTIKSDMWLYMELWTLTTGFLGILKKY